MLLFVLTTVSVAHTLDDTDSKLSDLHGDFTALFVFFYSNITSFKNVNNIEFNCLRVAADISVVHM